MNTFNHLTWSEKGVAGTMRCGSLGPFRDHLAPISANGVRRQEFRALVFDRFEGWRRARRAKATALDDVDYA